MITKVIGCADIHIKNLDNIDDIKNTLSYFIEDVKKIVEKEGGPEHVRVVVAGDIFDQKINVSNEAMLTAYWFFKNIGDVCKTYVIAGNHDYIVDNTDRLDSLTPIFQMAGDWPVVYLDSELGYGSGSFVDDNVVFHLFSSFSDFERPNIEEFREINPDKVHIGLIHADINGAVTYKDYVADKGLEPTIFENLDFVIAGHIHKRQEIKKNGVKIVYCSSITQKDFGEGVTEHGYVVWDITNDEFNYESVNLPIVKGFYQYSISDVKDFDNNKEKFMNL